MTDNNIITISSGSEADEEVKTLYIGNEPITEDLLDRLTSRAWLNDEIINAHLHLTCSDLEDVDYVNTYWMIKRYPVEWQPLRILFIPINLGNSHWALAVLWPRDRRLVYYDSMMNRRRGMRLLTEIWSDLKQKHDDCSLLEYLMDRLSLQSSFALECASACEQQSDGSSCGVFVCQWVTTLTTKRKWQSPEQFRHFMRKQLEAHRK